MEKLNECRAANGKVGFFQGKRSGYDDVQRD